MVAVKVRQILFVRPAPVVWAEHLGAFAAQGVEVETTQTFSSDQLGQRLADGTWDVGIGVMDNVIAWNSERRAGLRILAQLERSTVMGFFAVPECRALGDAAQRPIAVDSTTNGFVLVLYRALARAGIDWRACRYDAVGGVKHRFDALAEGRAVATILVPPFDAVARAKGFAELWRGADVAPHYPGVVACARAAWVAQEVAAATRYLRALIAANRWAARPENRGEAARALIAAGFSATAAERLVRELVPDLEPSVDGWNEVVALRRECSLLPQPEPTAQAVIDNQLRARAAEGV
jgi:ABC-type nitrate/sulfonate/bicarbonate transport system substrate-binding protein